MFFNYAHVPMSPRERTSLLIEWLRSKVYKKGLDLSDSVADWILVGGELHVGVVHCCSCSPLAM